MWALSCEMAHLMAMVAFEQPSAKTGIIWNLMQDDLIRLALTLLHLVFWGVLLFLLFFLLLFFTVVLNFKLCKNI